MGTASVLIVEDDENTRSILAEVLKSEGCDVKEAENGKRALELLADVRPDLIIVDLMMPVMNGWDLCSALEKDERLARIPVAILTALSSVHPLGNRPILPKPVRLTTLVALLDLVRAAGARRLAPTNGSSVQACG